MAIDTMETNGAYNDDVDANDITFRILASSLGGAIVMIACPVMYGKPLGRTWDGRSARLKPITLFVRPSLLCATLQET